MGLWLGGTLAPLAVGLRSGLRHGAGQTLQPFVVLLGVVALALGGVGLAPAAVALLGRGASRTRGMTHMALRGVARNRSQSAASVAAVAMALALPVGLLTVRAGNRDGRSSADQPAGQVPDGTPSTTRSVRADSRRHRGLRRRRPPDPVTTT